MTAPQPAPVPAQAPVPEVPAPAAAPVPEQEPGDQTAPWPPDEATLLQLQMEASFSIIDEPTGEEAPGADRQNPPVGTAPQPQQQAPPQTQG